VLSGVLFLLGAFLENPTWALVACIAAGFTGTSLWPTMLAVAADRYPDGGASMFAALAAFGNAGGIFMPWIIGYVGDVRDLHWGMATSAVAPFLLLGLVLVVLVVRPAGLVKTVVGPRWARCQSAGTDVVKPAAAPAVRRGTL